MCWGLKVMCIFTTRGHYSLTDEHVFISHGQLFHVGAQKQRSPSAQSTFIITGGLSVNSLGINHIFSSPLPHTHAPCPFSTVLWSGWTRIRHYGFRTQPEDSSLLSGGQSSLQLFPFHRILTPAYLSIKGLSLSANQPLPASALSLTFLCFIVRLWCVTECNEECVCADTWLVGLSCCAVSSRK